MSDPVTLVRDIMTSDPCVLSPDETLERAMTMMTQERCRHLPIVEGTQLVGMLSMSDIGRLAATIPSLMARTVRELMTKNPATVSPDEPIGAAAAQMGIRKVNCLPVVAGGKLVGIITTYDLLDALARQHNPRST